MPTEDVDNEVRQLTRLKLVTQGSPAASSKLALQ